MFILQGSQQLLRALKLYNLFQFNVFYKKLKKRLQYTYPCVILNEYLVRWSSG